MTENDKAPNKESVATPNVASVDLDADRPGGRAADAPRPPTPDDILEMMDKAQAEKANSLKARANADGAAGIVFWCAILAGVGAMSWLVWRSGGVFGDDAMGAVFVAGLTVVAGFALETIRRRAFPNFTIAVPMRADQTRATLAGPEILAALSLAEKIIDDDADARLVTRRDGVVVYANKAYVEIARDAGVLGASGLPPRIDRLFSQQGGDATKIFRLCRAAKDGVPAEETISQVMGLSSGGVRRFDISVRPVAGALQNVVWRLIEAPIEDAQEDAIAGAYADLPVSVFAVERSGEIVWANAAMRTQLGVDTAAGLRLEDIVLGEAEGVLKAIWAVDNTPAGAMIRGGDGDPVEVTFTAYRRVGEGEGYVCVKADFSEETVADDVALSGDISEAPFGIAIIDGELSRDGRVSEANKAFTDVFGGKRRNTPLSKIFDAKTLGELAAEAKKKQKGGLGAGVEVTIGEGLEAHVFALYPRPVKRKRGAYGQRKTLLYALDITDRKRMEVDYAQDQKLRGIGELASKVAHDFNNYLQVVLGHSDLLMLRHPAGDPAYQDLVQIRENAQRAANTTKQLLAFSRKQTLRQEVVSITEVLRDFSRFLTRAIGEKVRLELINGRALPDVRVDRYQLETAVMNLAVNARDAMAPKGGVLTIETKRIAAEETEALNISGVEGEDYLLIEIRDTGPGVPKEIREKIFDPFFTTKSPGKGTGLGLSTVYGSIRQMGGAIHLCDDNETGAIFQIYFPAYIGAEIPATPAPADTSASTKATDLTGSGRILVVEDEDAVRTFVIAALNDCGYEVVAVEDGEEALEILEDEGADFDLVLSDIMMSIMDGPTFVGKAQAELDLKSKVIFMSAYAENAMRDQLEGFDEAGYIQKPFTLKALASLVKDTLSSE